MYVIQKKKKRTRGNQTNANQFQSQEQNSSPVQTKYTTNQQLIWRQNSNYDNDKKQLQKEIKV